MHLEYVWVQTVSSSESRNSWTRYLPKAILTSLPQNHHQALDIDNSLILPPLMGGNRGNVERLCSSQTLRYLPMSAKNTLDIRPKRTKS